MTLDSDTAGASATPRRSRLTILFKLVVAFVVPTAVLFVAFAVVAHRVAAQELDDELGRRLTAVAATAAKQIKDSEYLIGLGPGDEDDRAYLRARRTLKEVGEATGVSGLYIFSADYRSVVDSADSVPVGSKYFQLEVDRFELERVFDDGVPKTSVLFEGKDGRFYKAAYAPVRGDTTTDIVLAVGVDAPAAFFDRLSSLRQSLLAYGLVLLVVVMGVAVLVAARISQPVRALADAAERIGRGELDMVVARSSNDEIGFLADTMEKMRSDLRARDERTQMMLAGIAHEVRNPLGGIELFSGILRDEIDPHDERRDHVERICRELGYLKRVVEDFLAYARRSPPEQGEVALAEVAEEVASLVRPDAEAAGLSLTVRSQPVVARGDAGQLRRALLNLVRNAVQAATGIEGGQIEVDIAGEGEIALVSVRNPGPAIPDEVRSRMFEPFYTSREKGTGLGLAFVREIVHDHGGTISLTSSDDEGTCFSLRLSRVA